MSAQSKSIFEEAAEIAERMCNLTDESNKVFKNIENIIKPDPLLAQIDIKMCEYLSPNPFQTGVLEIYGTKDEYTRVVLETTCGKVDAMNLFEHEALEALINE